MTVGTSNRNGRLIAHDLRADLTLSIVEFSKRTMVMASHCVGLTLPGIMELPGSFSGSINSPNPQRGPDPLL
jgi:hypothetical protein